MRRVPWFLLLVAVLIAFSLRHASASEITTFVVGFVAFVCGLVAGKLLPTSPSR